MSRLRIQSIRASGSEAYHGPEISEYTGSRDIKLLDERGPGPSSPFHPVILRAQVTETLSSSFKTGTVRNVLKCVHLRPFKKRAQESSSACQSWSCEDTSCDT